MYILSQTRADKKREGLVAGERGRFRLDGRLCDL